MKYLLLVIFLAFSSFIFAQSSPVITLDEKSGNQILVGKCSRADFSKVPYQDDYKFEYPNYKINDTTLNLLKGKSSNITIKIIMGCWCGDSKEQVPRFLKIMDSLNIAEKNLEFICVDRDKKADGIDLTGFGIEKVPTFIIYREEKELGRIIETPQVSLEKDLLLILSK